MFIDFNEVAVDDGAVLHNGVVSGGAFEDGSTVMMQGQYFEPGLRRPYLKRMRRGGPMERVVRIGTGRLVYNKQKRRYEKEMQTVRIAELQARGIFNPTWNLSAFRKDEYVNIDTKVEMATRSRLRAWEDLAAASSITGFDGMGKYTHEYEAMSDVGEAIKDMEMWAEGRTTNPEYKIRSIPLVITHGDWFITDRRLASSRNSGTPLDIAMGEMIGRRIGEMVEKTLIGVETGITFGTRSTGPFPHDGTSTEYGYTTFPYRVTKNDLNTPNGTNPEAVKQDFIEMRETQYANGYYGPFVFYTSTGYDAFLDDDYFRTGGTSVTTTLRARILGIDGVQDVRRLDFLTSGYRVINVQMTNQVAEAIQGMDIRTFRWEGKGGAIHYFKTACIMVGLLKAPFNGVAGIVDGTTS